MRLPCEQRIVCTYYGICPRVDRNYAVVLCYLFRKCDYLVFFRIAVRLVHETERPAEGSALHGFSDVFELLFDLLLCIRRRIIARHAGSYGTLTDQRHQVHVEIALRSLFELGKAARMQRIEKPAAYLVPVRSVRVDAEGREAAVACDLCGYALFDERPVVFLGILSVVEEIVV